jgi:bifunctional DNA-binding transcriptional regulator/antitoxin component of YhaV-PrlF toxin-antitoxin module
MTLLRINAKGTIKLPTDFCKKAGIKARDYLVITIKRGRILMTPLASFDQDIQDDLLELNDPKLHRAIQRSSKSFQAGKTRPAMELLNKISTEAKRQGLHPLSMRELDAEIRTYRRKRLKE